MLKKLLLQKGMSEAEADEIIAATAQENDSSLIALQKSLNSPEMDKLFKAKGGKDEAEEDGGDDDDEEYDEKFMKKHKKYMKKFGKGDDGKHDEPDGDEAPAFGKEMKKAVSDFDFQAEGGVVEMAELSPLIEAFVSTVSNLEKAISGLNRKVELISAQNEASFSLMAKAAAVQVETAETISGIASTPAGRKGIVVQDMAKAKSTAIVTAEPKTVWKVLAKAITGGDMKAGAIGSKFESSGMRINFLNQDEQKYVQELIAKEAN